MKFLSVAALGLFATFATADPRNYRPYHRSDEYRRDDDKCISRKDAKELAAAYGRLVGAFNEADLVYLSEDWTDVSQSISTFFANFPPAEPTTFTKASFKAAQTAGRAPTPITIISDPVLDCNKFAIKFTSTFGKDPHVVRGITIITAKKGKKHAVMTKWDVEFNSLIWLANLGGTYCSKQPPLLAGPGTCTP